MGVVAELPDEKPQFIDERQGLWALYTNADLSGGTVDLSRIGPTYRAQAVKFLRDLADRLERNDPT